MNVFFLLALVGPTFLGVDGFPVPTGFSSVTVVHHPSVAYSTLVHHNPYARWNPVYLPGNYVHQPLLYPLGYHRTPFLVLQPLPVLPAVTGQEKNATVTAPPSPPPKEVKPIEAVSPDYPEAPHPEIVADPVIVVPEAPRPETVEEPVAVVPEVVPADSPPAPPALKTEEMDPQGVEMVEEVKSNDEVDDTVAVDSSARKDVDPTAAPAQNNEPEEA